jgi:hypothetical protein
MRQYLSAMAWIAVTTAVIAGAQIVTTKAAAERRTVTKLNIELVENTVRIRELEAELRTRASMPELQRWNDAVFQLSAPQGAQILQSPLQLASFAARPDPAQAAPGVPSVQFAISRQGLPGAAPIPAVPRPPQAAGARVVNVSYPVAAVPSPPLVAAPPAAEIPVFIAAPPPAQVQLLPPPQDDAF